MGIIAAIAIPRLSRGASGAREKALVGDLDVMRRALEHYKLEHGGAIPGNAARFVASMTEYTDFDGNNNATKDAVHIYGPYLRAIPTLTVGDNRGSNAVQSVGAPGTGTEGWCYDPATGEIKANTRDSEVDALGVAYNTY